MSSTILMVIVLVVMWLVVLVPMFVHRHDDAEADPADLSVGARVLTRRVPPSRRARPYRHSPAGDVSPPAAEAIVDGAGEPPGWAEVAASAFSADEARRRMLHRRRRTLLALLALAIAGFAGAELLTAWFWGVQLLGTVLLVGYVGWLRRQVRREQARRRRRAALSARSARPPSPAPPVHRRAGHPPTDRHRVAGHRSAAHPAPAAGRGAASTSAVDRGPEPTTASGWQPVPVPTPTYVTKPPAPRVDRIVSLDDDDPALVDIDPVVEPVERRRAVNG
jgi:hypothetical protein